jgi:hypothetical protein
MPTHPAVHRAAGARSAGYTERAEKSPAFAGQGYRDTEENTGADANTNRPRCKRECFNFVTNRLATTADGYRSAWRAARPRQFRRELIGERQFLAMASRQALMAAAG